MTFTKHDLRTFLKP